jgi:hypothetical protein
MVEIGKKIQLANDCVKARLVRLAFQLAHFSKGCSSLGGMRVVNGSVDTLKLINGYLRACWWIPSCLIFCFARDQIYYSSFNFDMMI